MELNQQKEQFSSAYIRAVASVAGFVISKPEVDDDSIDFCIGASGDQCAGRRPRVELQLKCTADESALRDGQVAFDLKRKNFDDLRTTDVLVPRILVVVLVPASPERWLDQTEEQLVLRNCAYWASLRGDADGGQQTKVTVKLERRQVFSPTALEQMMQRIAQGGNP